MKREKLKTQSSKRWKLDVIPIDLLLARTRRRRRTTRVVHDEQVICADLLAFPDQGRNCGIPMSRGDSSALPPLQSTPMADREIGSHVGGGIPAIEQIIDSLHAPLIARDNLSSQTVTRRPVTNLSRSWTMRPMGKATTPASFKRAFCERLKAARIMARLEQMDVARELGLLANTYSKYEKRSLLPHHLMLQVCDLLDVDLNYLYGVGPARSKAREAAEPASVDEQSRLQDRA